MMSCLRLEQEEKRLDESLIHFAVVGQRTNVLNL